MEELEFLRLLVMAVSQADQALAAAHAYQEYNVPGQRELTEQFVEARWRSNEVLGTPMAHLLSWWKGVKWEAFASWQRPTLTCPGNITKG